MSDKNFTIPEVHTFDHIIQRAKDKIADDRKPRCALVVPSEGKSLEAFCRATDAGLIEPFIVGDEKLARKKATSAGLDIGSARFIDINEPDLAVQASLKMAMTGEIDAFVLGRYSAVELLALMLDKSGGFVGKGRTLSHLAAIKPSRYKKLLFLTDAAVNMEPDLKIKLALIDNAVKVAKIVGVDMPRVAVIAAVEVIYPQMPVTMDAAVISKMADRKQIKGAYVDGPLSFDIAVDMFAAQSKGITDSKVAGQADILLAPNIETANGIYKAMSLYGKSQLGGVIYGGKVPAVVSSYSDSVETRFHSIVLASLVASSKEG
ncbi:MAG: phosphate acyltransferase [Candidatus Zixiibacteriota bacterium]